MFHRFLITICLIDLSARSLPAAPVVLDWSNPQSQGPFSSAGAYRPAPQSSLATRFALSDDGALCTFDAVTGEAVIYPKLGSDGSLDGEIRRRVGVQPTAVAFKRIGLNKSYFAIGCADSSVWILDAQKGYIRHKILTQAAFLNGLAAAANPDVGYIYYSGGYQARLGRIDLNDMRDEGIIALPPGAPSNPVQIASSPDGTILYADLFNFRPAGYWAFKVSDSRPLRATQLNVGSSQTPVMLVPSPDGNFVAAGPKVFPPDLSTATMTNPGNTLAFSAKRPLMFCVADDGEIDAVSTNSGTTIATTQPVFAPPAAQPIPAPSTAPGAGVIVRHFHRIARDALSGNSFVMFVDDTHAKLILANEAHVAVVAIRDLHVPSEPIVGVTVKAEPSVIAGQRWSATLTRADPSIKLALVNPPAGMTLQDDQLSWTPSQKDVGSSTIHLSFSADNIHRDLPINLTVMRAGIVLPFAPDLIAIAPDGHRAVVAQLQVYAQPANPVSPDAIGPQDGLTSLLAVIDLDKQTVICNRGLLTPLQTAAVDSNFVYIAKPQSAAFTALSLRDLSDVTRVFTDGPIQNFIATGQRLYVDQLTKPVTWYSVPDLTPDEGPPMTQGQFQMRLNRALPKPLDGGWYDNGVIFDHEFGLAKRIIQDNSFKMIGGSRLTSNFPGDGAPNIGPWHGQTDRRRGGGAPIEQMPMNSADTRVLFPDRPLVAALAQYRSEAPTRFGNSPDFIRTQINLYELASGDRLDPIVLSDGPRPRASYATTDRLKLFITPQALVALVGNQVFVVPLGTIGHRPLTVPLSIKRPDGTVLLSGAHASFIHMQIDGGKKPVHFELSEDMPGVEIDPNNGIVKVIPRFLIDPAAAAFAPFNNIPGMQNPRRNYLGPTIEQYQAVASERVNELTGNPASGIPMELMLTVIARDSDGQIVRTLVAFLVDLPADPIRAKLAMPAQPNRPPISPPNIPGNGDDNTKPV